MDDSQDNYLGKLVLDVMDNITKANYWKTNGCISSGFKTLDKYIGGIRPGSLGVIASRPGDGRTAFAITLAMNLAFSDNPSTVGFFSYEISNRSVVERMIANKARMDMLLLREGCSSPELKTRIEKTADFIYSRSKNFILQDSPGLTIDKLSSQIRDMAYKDGVKTVFIDGYGLVGQENFNLPKIDRNTVVCRSLSLLASELDIAIICVCPLHTGERRRPPLLVDLREFGLIDRFADYIVFLDDSSRYFPPEHLIPENDNDEDTDYDFRRRKVIVAKSKYGFTAVFNMEYNEKCSLFREK